MATQFDGTNKIISLGAGTTSISVRSLWSDWIRWHSTSDNSKYLFAFNLVGGNPIDAAAGTYIPFYVYLMNGWKIRPQDSDHTLDVTEGILLVDGGGDPFINTLSNRMVRINYHQPVQAITVASGGSPGISDQSIADAVKTNLLPELQEILKNVKLAVALSA